MCPGDAYLYRNRLCERIVAIGNRQSCVAPQTHATKHFILQSQMAFHRFYSIGSRYADQSTINGSILGILTGRILKPQ